jgi:hypothetical protein
MTWCRKGRLGAGVLFLFLTSNVGFRQTVLGAIDQRRDRPLKELIVVQDDTIDVLVKPDLYVLM